MKYVRKECESFNLHMIKTDKFKTTLIDIIFENEIKKETLTKTLFLSTILPYSTKNYPSKIEFERKLEDLYSAKINCLNTRTGSLLRTDIAFTVLEDKYTEDGLFDKGLDFLHEIVFNPNMINGELNEDAFNYAQNGLKARILREKEDPRRCSLSQLLINVDKDAKYALKTCGYLEDLEMIDRKNICDFYKDFIDKSLINIFVVGNIDFDEIYKKISEKFKFKKRNIELKEFIIPEKKHNKELKELFEKDNTNQAKLSIACTTEKLTEYERRYVINLYNFILGGSADSKFFKNIREKHSLCYYVSSRELKFDNLLLISSGIKKENYKQMIELIEKEMDNMRKGNFSIEDMNKGKKYYSSILEETEDYPYETASAYFQIYRRGSDSIDVAIKKFNEITKEDIIKIASKIHMDTVYTLGGDKK